LNCLVHIRHVLVKRQQQDTHARTLGCKPARQGKAVELGHRNIEHRHIRTLLANDLQRRHSCCSLSDDFDRALRFEKMAKPGPENWMVVGENDTNNLAQTHGTTSAPARWMRAKSVVPRPREDSISNSPRIRARRSFMPGNPSPRRSA